MPLLLTLLIKLINLWLFDVFDVKVISINQPNVKNNIMVWLTHCGHWMILSRVGCVILTNCISGRAPRTKETLPDFL